MFYKISAMIFVAVAVSAVGIYFAMPSDNREPKFACPQTQAIPISEGASCCIKPSSAATGCSARESSWTTAKSEALGACVGGSFAVTAKPLFTCCDE